jgi:predicted membrane protein
LMMTMLVLLMVMLMMLLILLMMLLLMLILILLNFILIKVNKRLPKLLLKRSKPSQTHWESGRQSWLKYVHMLVCFSYILLNV